MAQERIRYCPTDGRVTEKEIWERIESEETVCSDCISFATRTPKFKAKRHGET